MKTEITKKKTLIFKRHALTTPAEEASVEPEIPAPETPPEATPVEPVKSPGSPYMVSAILALVAVLLFMAVILVQVLELAEYRKPPTVWPLLVQQVPTPSESESNALNELAPPVPEPESNALNELAPPVPEPDDSSAPSSE